MTSETNRAFEEVWTRRLAKESEDLNFDDEDDRTGFRGRIFEATRNASWKALRRIAAFLGTSDIPRSRDRTVRLIVNRWIERARSGDRHARKKTPTQLNREIAEVLASPRGFNRYRDLPVDEAHGNPQHAWGAVHANRLGSYWTVAMAVPLAELAGLRPVMQSSARLKSVTAARKAGLVLPPIELGVFKDGTAWIVDGNHRLIDARKAQLPNLPVTFTFVGT